MIQRKLCVLEFTDYLIQRVKKFNWIYTNTQMNNIKEKINPVDFTSRQMAQYTYLRKFIQFIRVNLAVKYTKEMLGNHIYLY